MKNQNANIEKIIFIEINKTRKKKGINPLKSNHCYAKLSRGHSIVMAKQNNVFHGNNVKRTHNCHKSISLDPLWTKERVYLLSYVAFLILLYLYNNALGSGLIILSVLVFSMNFKILKLSLMGNRGNYAGENCAVIPKGHVKGFDHEIKSDQDVAKALHQMWMKSPGHRKNILDGNFYRVGIGVYRKGNRFYATELFSD